jgi:hypothetical protein
MILSRLPKWSLTSLFLAAAGAGAWFALRDVPAARPADEPPLRFEDATDQARITFRHTSGARGRKFLPETMGAGVAVIDFDGDGKPDLFFVNSRPWPGDPSPDRATPALFRNRGDGTFEDVTAACGLDVELYGMGVAVGDFDNDGRPDIFITAVGGNRLFRNVGGTRFEDVTDRAGLGGRSRWPGESAADFARHADPISFPSSAVWLDYDGDGRLDLFVCNYVTWSPAHDLGVAAVLPGGTRAYVPPQQFAGTQCELYRNVDGRRFEDVSVAAGVRVSEKDGPNGAARPVAKALGVVVCDPDDDGWPDVVVANDTVRNLFFHNVPGPNGTRTFEESALYAGIAYSDGRPRGGMGIDAGELAPGVRAVVVANFTNEPDSLFQLIRRDPVGFADVAPEVGLAGVSRAAMKFGAVFADFDNDGRLDLFTANGHLEPDIAVARSGQSYRQAGQLFWNTGRRSDLFAPVSGPGGADVFPPMVGRGCAYLDYDGDGKLDLAVTENNGRARLFRNDTPAANAWVRLGLSGNGRGTNRDGIGAAVTIEAGGAVQHRYVTGARGYLSQSELVLTVGLGTATVADKVTVRWPGAGAGSETWTNLEAGRTHTLKQGEGK